MERRYRIETFTEELMHARVREVLALEEVFYRQFGLSYSHEIWTERHFLYPLPGKWELSNVAFDKDDRLVGFWISSYQNNEELRGHRAGVHPEWRGAGVLRALFEAVHTDAKRLGFKYISGTTNAANPASLPAWLALGFQVLSGAELAAFKARRGRDRDRIEGDHLVSPEGYAYYALQRDIK
jgi:GNAT superfamily N-acetyltransferase